MDVLNHPVLRQRGPLVINIQNKSECYYCKTGPLNDQTVFCPSCGFPQYGTEEQQKKFITDKRLLLIQYDGVNESVKKARNALFGVAVLYGISYLVLALTAKMVGAALIEGGIICSLFIGLGIWANKNPLPAVLSGLILFIIIILLYAAINPLSLFAGIIWKVVIISALVYGFQSAKKAKEFKVSLEAAQINMDATSQKN